MNIFARVLSLMPAIEAAVLLVRALPHLTSNQERQDAAVALVKTGLTASEAAVGHELVNHPAFDEVVRAGVDAVVAVQKLTTKPAPVVALQP